MIKNEISNELKCGKVASNGDVFITPKGRVMFHDIFRAKAYENNKPKFSVTLVFDKSEIDITTFKNWCDDKLSKAPFKSLMGAKNPLRDADLDGKAVKYEQYKNCYYINASTGEGYPPEVKNELNKPIKESDGDVYSGCYARVIVSSYPYDKAGNKGVNLNLVAFQKVADGSRFAAIEIPAVDTMFSPVVDGPMSMDAEEAAAPTNPFGQNKGK